MSRIFGAMVLTLVVIVVALTAAGETDRLDWPLVTLVAAGFAYLTVASKSSKKKGGKR